MLYEGSVAFLVYPMWFLFGCPCRSGMCSIEQFSPPPPSPVPLAPFLRPVVEPEVEACS